MKLWALEVDLPFTSPFLVEFVPAIRGRSRYALANLFAALSAAFDTFYAISVGEHRIVGVG